MLTYIHKVKPKNAQNEKCKKNYMGFLNIEYVIMIYIKEKNSISTYKNRKMRSETSLLFYLALLFAHRCFKTQERNGGRTDRRSLRKNKTGRKSQAQVLHCIVVADAAQPQSTIFK